MSVHRFRELWNSSEQSHPYSRTALDVGHDAFVPCPCPVVLGMSAIHQAQVEYLYRLAFEQAQAQVAQARVSRWPAFSLN
jgi:hypothetical protein